MQPEWRGLPLRATDVSPNDIEVEALLEDDRPYAGLLYGGVSLLDNEQHDG